MSKLKFTNEAKPVFEYIKNDMAQEFSLTKIPIECFLLAVLRDEGCKAHDILSRCLTEKSVNDLEEWCISRIFEHSTETRSRKPYYDASYDRCGEWCMNSHGTTIDTGIFLLSVASNVITVSEKLMTLGVYTDTIDAAISSLRKGGRKDKKKVVDKKKKEEGPVEKYLKNITHYSSITPQPPMHGVEDTIDDMYRVFLKGRYNNVLLVGEKGSGKTSIVWEVANRLFQGNCPYMLRMRDVVEMDLFSMRNQLIKESGGLPNLEPILDDLKDNGRYILFIDDVDRLFVRDTRMSTDDIADVLFSALIDGSIPCVFTVSEYGAAKIPDELTSMMTKIVIKEKCHEEYVDIVREHAQDFSIFHGVSFPDDVIEYVVTKAERSPYSIGVIPTATDMIDRIGADIVFGSKRFDKVICLEDEIMDIEEELSTIKQSTVRNRDRYNDLVAKQIDKKKMLDKEREKLFGTIRKEKASVSKAEKSIRRISQTEKGKLDALRGLEDRIKSEVIGQDESVDTIVRSIKRRRIGVSNPNKPYTALMVGSTGCGKTLLAKKVAEALFGSENKMVRLDMSEYADQTSVTKLYGSSAGYVGYDNGGVLTEAIKKHGECVLLLDEIEKADPSVFDAFLQVFDEGRMTDNHGVTVKFNDVIILMTSNVGTKDVKESENTIGFTKGADDISSQKIIKKAIEKKFKPEFINRIDDILYFNRLSDKSILDIIKKEIKVVEERLIRIGYSFDDDIYNGDIVKGIQEDCDKDKEYGARPILRSIQKRIEDPVTNIIINGGVKSGHRFSEKEILTTESLFR